MIVNGAGPPAFGAPKTIHEIRLLTAQFPAGTTFHRIEGRKATGGWLSLAKLNAVTDDAQWIRAILAAPVNDIRWIRVKTQKSPSWVSWREIQVY